MQRPIFLMCSAVLAMSALTLSANPQDSSTTTTTEKSKSTKHKKTVKTKTGKVADSGEMKTGSPTSSTDATKSQSSSSSETSTTTSSTTQSASAAQTGDVKSGDAAKGKEVFEQCGVCHNADSAEKKMGPGLKGLFAKDKMANGKKPTEPNVRAKIDEGGNGMPAYKDMLTDEEKNNLIAYLRTL